MVSWHAVVVAILIMAVYAQDVPYKQIAAYFISPLILTVAGLSYYSYISLNNLVAEVYYILSLKQTRHFQEMYEAQAKIASAEQALRKAREVRLSIVF